MYTRLGDMSQHLKLRQNNDSLKSRLHTLTQELNTGYAENKLKKLNSQTAQFSNISHNINLLKTFEASIIEVKNTLKATQSVLEKINDSTARLSKGLILTPSKTSRSYIMQLETEAKSSFDEIVSALNTNVAGKALLSGASIDKQPLSNASEIMNDLFQHVSQETTVKNIIDKVDDWFERNSNGFQDRHYKGGTSHQKIAISNDRTIPLEVTANNPTIRNVLKATALAALSERMTSLPLSDKSSLLFQAGTRLHALSQDQGTLQARVGFLEEKVELTGTQNASEQKALNIHYNELLGVDRFETASNLNAVKSQLEMHYQVTASLSRLNLTHYL